MYDNGNFRSNLEVPDGRDPEQNAWLTLTLYYGLTFADSNNPVPGVIVQQGTRFMAKDSDGWFVGVCQLFESTTRPHLLLGR
jgi:hypothetical protein